MSVIVLVYLAARVKQDQEKAIAVLSLKAGSLEGVVGEPEAFSTAPMTFTACISCSNHPLGAGLTITTGTGCA